MHVKHIQAAAVPLLALILLVFAPQSIAAPSGTEAILEATGTGLAYLEVELRPKKGEDPFRFKLGGSRGLIVGGMTVRTLVSLFLQGVLRDLGHEVS